MRLKGNIWIHKWHERDEQFIQIRWFQTTK